MPHCIIEHSNTIDIEPVIPCVFEGTKNSNLFEPTGNDIKVRAIGYDDYLVGQNKSDFLHITIKILSGRNIQQKQSLSQSVLKQLNQLKLNNCSITIEVMDIDTESYVKSVLG